MGPRDPSQGAGPYLSVMAAGQASAARPPPGGECRHQAVTARRKSPRRGACTPRSNPPLQGSQTPEARRGEGWENTGLRPAMVLLINIVPTFLPTVLQSQSNSHPELDLAVTSGLKGSQTHCPAPPVVGVGGSRRKGLLECSSPP